MSNLTKEGFLDKLKAYIFPTLVTIIGMMIWRDINEMRADVKMLLAQSNIDKTRIENLEKDIKQIESVVFNKKLTSMTHMPMFMKLYFKPEEEFDVKKYINKQV